MSTTKVLLMGCEEEKKSGDADLWIKIWEELHRLAARYYGGSGACQGTAHKEKKEMSHFAMFVTEGNEKADELAKAGAMLDEGFAPEARAKTMQQCRRSRTYTSTGQQRTLAERTQATPMSKSRDRPDEPPRDEVLEQQNASARAVGLEWTCGRVAVQTGTF